MDKKLIGGILGILGATALIVYLVGVDSTTPFAPHRIVGFGDAGSTCPIKLCWAVDAGKEAVQIGEEVVEATRQITDCTVTAQPCPALRCRVATAVFAPAASEAARLGLPEATTATKGYVRVRVCGDPEHGLPFPELPLGASLVGDWQDVAFTAGYQAMDLWLQVPTVTAKSLPAADVAPFGCRCGPGCRDKAGKPLANAAVVLPSGQVTAPDAGDCISVPCVALQGERPDLDVCCAAECAGRSCGTGLCGGSCGECQDGYTCVGYTCKLSVVEKVVEEVPTPADGGR